MEAQLERPHILHDSILSTKCPEEAGPGRQKKLQRRQAPREEGVEQETAYGDSLVMEKHSWKLKVVMVVKISEYAKSH